MPRRRLLSALPVLVLLTLLLAVPPWAAAQDATPGPGAGAFPIDPAPAECQVAPRAIGELIRLWYGPEGAAGASPVPAEAPTAVTIPVGVPADEATVAGVVATVREVFACFEAGDFLRAAALYTDDLARAFGPGPGTSEADARAFLAAPPAPETAAAASLIVAIADATVLADGRVGAFVVEQSADEGTHVAYVILERAGARWLVDEVIEFGGAEDEEEEARAGAGNGRSAPVVVGQGLLSAQDGGIGRPVLARSEADEANGAHE